MALLAPEIHGFDESAARQVDVESSTGVHIDPPKVLVIGPDSAGNLLEVILLVLADDRMIAIHAMKLRRHFHELLPGEEGSP